MAEPSSQNSSDYVNWFRHSSPYINAHRGRTFVLLLSGEAVADENFANIIHDIALLNSLGVKLVLCVGARPQIEATLAQQQLSSQFFNNLRITDLKTLDCIAQAVGSQRCYIESLLSMGLPNSPMHGADIRVISGNFVSAKPLGVVGGVDYQHTGQVRKIDAKAIRSFLDQQHIIMLSQLAYSATGEMFNLSLQDLAEQTALALQADKIISFEQASGVLDAGQNLMREFDLLQHSLADLPDSSITPGLKAAIYACEHTQARGHIISYQQDGALLQELFTRDGAGTLLNRGNYETIRAASIDDVGGILELIAPLEDQGVLVKRSREVLETEIEQFTVIDRDGTIIACAALYPYANSQMAELACIATHPDYQGRNLAPKLLEHLQKSALGNGLKEVFVLTTQTAHWFIEQGFIAGELEQLPGEKKALYNYQRNSKVFFKNLL